MGAEDQPQPGAAQADAALPQAHGPATAPQTPLVTPFLADATRDAFADDSAPTDADATAGPTAEREGDPESAAAAVPTADASAESTGDGPPTRTRAQRWVASALGRAPRPVVRFSLLWWAVISGRRVTGLAAEAAFWVVFSLPWLMLAFISGLGLLASYSGQDTVDAVEQRMLYAVEKVLTPEAAAQYATPILQDMFQQGRADLGIIGLVLAIWTGSRAVMTYVEAVTIINGEFGVRGYARRRVLSGFMYVAGILLMVMVSPVIIAGPEKVGSWLGLSSTVVTVVSFALSFVVMTLLLTSLFHFSAVHRKAWWSSLPGALLAVVFSSIAAVVLTFYVRRLFSESSVYGVLATPVAIMIFAYVLSLIALMGAAFDAVRIGRPIFRSEPIG